MAKRKEKTEDLWTLKAVEPLFIILCRDGTPHPGYGPLNDYDSAQELIPKLPCIEKCAPHRVQAYRPMM